jgi:hypothetical protein
MALGLAVAAVVTPVAQGISIPEGWENAQFGPASLSAVPQVTIPEVWEDPQFGPASFPARTIAVPAGWENAYFGPANLGPQVVTPAQVVGPDGFDYLDAVVGGACALAAMLLAAAVVLFTRRRGHLARA